MSRPSRRRALLIGTSGYESPGFAALPCAAYDVRGVERVLSARSIGGFEQVVPVTDLDAESFKQAVHDFLDASEHDEQALVYISGHGMRHAATGEFHFIARDSDPHDLARTAVPAGFLNDRLLECRARERVVILDCCYSGGFAVGLRTKGERRAAAAQNDECELRPLRTKGVVVISSSQASEVSYTGTEPDGPSLFTEELIRALATGAADRDRDGRVSAMELYEHLSSKLRAQDHRRRQAPVISAVGVDGPIHLAAAPQTRGRRGPKPGASPQTAGAGPGGGPAASAAPGLRELIGYYRDCVQGEAELEAKLVFEPSAAHYVPLSGSDRLLSAAGTETDGLLPVPEELRELAARAVAERGELVYGYPVVVLHADRAGQALRTPRLAPLLMRRLELAQADDGEIRLRPYGEVEVNAQFAKLWLGGEEAESLRASYQPAWTTGDLHTMARDIKALLRDTFELECVEELRPERFEPTVETAMPISGARNAAVMMAVASDQASAMLLQDLDDIAAKCAEPAALRQTALAALFGPGDPAAAPPTEAAAAFDASEVMLSPLNPAQREVLARTLSQRLTVATGPPGTGKSALVVSVVGAVVAAGGKVLVASTNNRAVDEVWRRCSGAVPGLVVRTGSSSGEVDNRERERLGLLELLALEAPAANVATWRARHAVAVREHREALARYGGHAQSERERLAAGMARQRARDAVPRVAGRALETVGAADAADLGRIEANGAKAARARLLGDRRRRRFLRRAAGLAVTPGEPTLRELCAAVGALAASEARWRRSTAVPLDDDTRLAELLAQAEKNVVDASTGLVSAQISQYARIGRIGIQELADAVTRRAKDWYPRKKALPAVPAWAVTCLSARKFTPDPGLFDLVVIDEASQCSIAEVLPLLLRARRALVIGDPLQLPPVVKLPPAAEADSRERRRLDPEWLFVHRAGYRDFSAFHALETAAGGSIRMYEHYRCHPWIAAISNDLFYRRHDRPLTVLTRTSALLRVPKEPAVRWVDVEGRAYRGAGASWVNEREAERVGDAVKWLLEALPARAEIGVVTPFAAQAARISRAWAGEPRVRVGTAHRFQGGECDAVVFSLVAAHGMGRSGTGFLERSPNLWNVAITRARAHLIIVGDRDYWIRAGGLGRSLLELAEQGPAQDGPGAGIVPGIPDALILERLDPGQDGSVELAVPSADYRADALVSSSTRRTAYLIDGGVPDGVPGELHLRLQLIRASLLAAPGGGTRAARLPAWRLFDETWRPGAH